MTTAANTAGDPWPYNYGNSIWPYQQWYTCPSCGMSYQGWHQCDTIRPNTTSPVWPTYITNNTNTKDSVFEEFKKLYRKLVLEDFYDYLETILTEEGVDDELSTKLLDRFYKLTEQLIRTGPVDD